MKSFADYREEHAGDEFAYQLAALSECGIVDPDQVCDEILEVFATYRESEELYTELMAGLQSVGKNLSGMMSQGWKTAKNLGGQALQAMGQGAQKLQQHYQQGERGAQVQRAIAAVQQLQQQLKQMGYANPQIDNAFKVLGTQLQQAASFIQHDPHATLGPTGDAFGANQAVVPATPATAPQGPGAATGGGYQAPATFGAGL